MSEREWREPTGFVWFAPAGSGNVWVDVYRRIIQNYPHGRGRRVSRFCLFGSGSAGLGSPRGGEKHLGSGSKGSNPVSSSGESSRFPGPRRPLPGIRIRRAEHGLPMDRRYRRGHCNRQPASRRFQFPLFDGLTPETETSCFCFWSAANGYRQNDPEATEQLYREIAPTFLEDKEMVEAQQKRLDEFGEQGLVDIASDANRMHMRRIVERLIVSEQSAVAAK